MTTDHGLTLAQERRIREIVRDEIEVEGRRRVELMDQRHAEANRQMLERARQFSVRSEASQTPIDPRTLGTLVPAPPFRYDASTGTLVFLDPVVIDA